MSVWNDYLKGVEYNNAVGLYSTVENNENFFIGRQWEGVVSNGLPTPVFNFIKRVVNFLVASVAADRLAIRATAHANRGADGAEDAVNNALDAIVEETDLGSLVRRMVRNAAVDGDGCIYAYWDAEAGGVRAETLENTRVIFGDPNEKRVQKQPYIIIVSREDAENARARAFRYGSADAVAPDGDETGLIKNEPDGKTTVLLRLRRASDGHIVAGEYVRGGVLRPEWDTGLTNYPLVWLSWDEVRDSYHGMAAVSGLIPNQVFVNKLFAMAMISLMTTAYPKVVYDRTRIERWDNRVGAAIGVAGGDVANVARIIDPAQISPQIGQFIELAISYTQNFMGATDTALGNIKPENTSAIIAVQKASAIPLEMVKLELARALEELGRVFIDFMAAMYGRREGFGEGAFDFSTLRGRRFRLRLDVGASSYWSELTAVQTLDNLLSSGRISLAEYLERIPEGYITGREELLERAKGETKA